jgi:hypothetical protein
MPILFLGGMIGRKVGKRGVLGLIAGRTYQHREDLSKPRKQGQKPHEAMSQKGLTWVDYGAHGHDDGALLGSQMLVDFRHGGTLQQKVLHLVFENAQRFLRRWRHFFTRSYC